MLATSRAGGKRMFLQNRSDQEPVFECNRYPDGSFLVEQDVVDRVASTEHVTEGCPEFPSQ